VGASGLVPGALRLAGATNQTLAGPWPKSGTRTCVVQSKGSSPRGRGLPEHLKGLDAAGRFGGHMVP
jgi:hypothetical protein